ncbi:hypothetical protein AAHA92_16533 [Salvia divinorum]|uniref:Uncharacterized protein n=1 Tax=Salvia divinorum TaxID=28513 RepID=A0ABD1GVV9_SALDI
MQRSILLSPLLSPAPISLSISPPTPSLARTQKPPRPAEMPRAASVGSTTPPSDDYPPQGVLELLDMGLSPDNIEADDTTDSFDWSEMDDDFHYFLPCMEDEHGRKIIQLRGENLHPSTDASDICDDAFKKIVDPIGFCHLSDEYMNIYWEEFKKKANTGSYDQDLYKKAFVKKCKGRYDKYIYNLKRRKKKPAYFTGVMWKAYTDAWKTLEAADGSSANCKLGQETAHGTHSNDSVSYAETTETMSKKNDGKRPANFDLSNMTRKRTKKKSLEICSMCTLMAAQIQDMARAGELQTQGIENPSAITSNHCGGGPLPSGHRMSSEDTGIETKPMSLSE